MSVGKGACGCTQRGGHLAESVHSLSAGRDNGEECRLDVLFQIVSTVFFLAHGEDTNNAG